MTDARSLMPGDKKEKDILKKRAEALAYVKEEAADDVSLQEYVKFRLGEDGLYGIPYHYIEEVLYVSSIAKVPCTPSFIVGVINRRGELLNVIDPKKFFASTEKGSADEARILVVRENGLEIGLLVDAVETNDYYDSNQLAQPVSSDGVSNLDYILGIHDGSISLLNIRAILTDTGLIVNETVTK